MYSIAYQVQSTRWTRWTSDQGESDTVLTVIVMMAVVMMAVMVVVVAAAAEVVMVQVQVLVADSWAGDA